MSLNNDIKNLEKILVAISRIKVYIKDFDLNKFIADDKTQDAVFRNLIVIGNCIKDISNSAKEDFSEIENSQIKSVSNYLSVDYFGEDNKIIWELVSKHLLKYKEIILEIKEKIEQ